MRRAVSALAFSFIGFVVGAVFFSAVSVVLAWTGPTSAPPNGNVAAPINVGGTAQVKNGALAINALAVFGNSILSGPSVTYLNFGNTSGSSGYGLRDNAGTLEFKNSGGSWSNLSNSVLNVLGTGAVTQIKFSDGTTQTTAQTASDAGVLCGLATGQIYGSCGGSSYSSVATCKGQSVAASCPAGYTLQSITMSQIAQTCTGACQPRYYCLRTCSKN